VTTPQFPRPTEKSEWQSPPAAQPPYQPDQGAPSPLPGKPHRARNIVLSAVGVIIAIRDHKLTCWISQKVTGS
jgi:hypothetical protein